MTIDLDFSYRDRYRNRFFAVGPAHLGCTEKADSDPAIRAYPCANRSRSGRECGPSSRGRYRVEMSLERAAFALIHSAFSFPHQAGRQVSRGLHRIS